MYACLSLEPCKLCDMIGGAFVARYNNTMHIFLCWMNGGINGSETQLFVVFLCKMWQFLQQNLKFLSNIGNFGLILQKTHRNKHIFILMKCLTKKNRTNIIKTGVALFSFGCFFPFVFFIHHQNCSSLLLSNIFSSFWIRNSMNHIIYYQNGAYFCLVQFYNIIATIFKWIMYTWIVQMR